MYFFKINSLSGTKWTNGHSINLCYVDVQEKQFIGYNYLPGLN